MQLGLLRGDLEAWLASRESRADVGYFMRWANKQKLTSLQLPAVRWHGPAGVIDTETRWQHARRLLHDDTVLPEDRVAGLLVLLYAQTTATISQLTLDHVQTSDAQLRLRLGREPVILSPSRSTLSSDSSSPPAAATPPSATTEPHPGCSPADNPHALSPHSGSLNACAASASTPDRPVPPHCSNSPPTYLPPSSPARSASTSASQQLGNAPAPATGPTRPPKSAAETTTDEGIQTVPISHSAAEAGWSHADRAVLTAAATNVLHAVNTIAAGVGLDGSDEPGERRMSPERQVVPAELAKPAPMASPRSVLFDAAPVAGWLL